MNQGHLILGCKGREQLGVMLCGGTSFVILDLNSISKTDVAFHKYVFDLLKLDKGPLVDYNACLNLIQFLINGYLDQMFAAPIFEWISIHKKCGIYIYREIND